MAIQAVPFALQNASHSAALFRQSASAAFATGGILAIGEMALSQQGTPNMSVVLGAGRAKVAGNSVSPPAGLSFTTQAMYDVLNDAALTLTVTASNATNPRIDAAWVQVQDSFYSGAANTAVPGVTAGVPAPTPAAPAVPTNAILIGYIAVGANVTTIVNANLSYQAILATLTNTAPPSSLNMTRINSGFTVAGTGVNISPTGTVVASAASTISVNNCFTALYDNYELIYDFTSGASVGLSLALRAAGVDITSSNYDLQVMSSQVTAVGGGQTLASTGWSISSNTQPIHSGRMTIFHAAAAIVKTFLLNVGSYSNPMGANSANSLKTGLFRLASASDGFTITIVGGTATGTIRIYGWNN